MVMPLPSIVITGKSPTIAASVCYVFIVVTLTLTFVVPIRISQAYLPVSVGIWLWVTDGYHNRANAEFGYHKKLNP